jgi:hypothetical protein
MCSGGVTRALPRVGFPIRKSRDQRLVSTYPGLIAAAHVLHRLLAPRHPPYALHLLIMKNTMLPLWSFQGARGLEPPKRDKPPASGGLSKLNSVRYVEVDVISRRARNPDGFGTGLKKACPASINGSNAYRSNCSGIP